MKTRRIIRFAALLLFATALFYACQKDRNESVTMTDQDVKMLKNEYNEADCGTACLQAGTFEQTTASFTRQWSPLSKFPGYWKSNKYFITTAWNDADYFYLKTDIYGYQYSQHQEGSGPDKYWVLDGPEYNNYPFISVVITLNGMEYTYSMDNPETIGVIETATTYTQAYPLPNGWTSCAPMNYSVKLVGDGQQVWLGTAEAPAYVSYNLIGHCTSTILAASPGEMVCPGQPVTLTGSVSSPGSDFDGGTISIVDDADLVVASAAVNMENGIYSVTYTYTTEAGVTRTFTARYDGTGSNGYNPSESDAVTVYSEACCVTAFNGQALLCGLSSEVNYTFTYQGQVDYVKLQGSLLSFTNYNSLAVVYLNDVQVIFDLVEYLPNDDIIYTGVNIEGYLVKQMIPSVSPDRVISIEGPASCSPLSIRMVWDSPGTDAAVTGEWTATDEAGNIIGYQSGLSCP